MARDDVHHTPDAVETARLADLIDVAAASAILIHDVWVGYNEACPLVARYVLRRAEGGGLSGEAKFSTGTMPAPKRLPVVMRAATAKAFLDAIGGAELVRGPYVPLREHTDDYPLIEIVIEVPPQSLAERGGFLLLHTKSQGELHAPWAAFVDGGAWVVKGDVVGRALAALDRTLKRSELRRLAGFTRR